jgi:hypothetical protein
MSVTYEDVYLWMIEQGATKQREIYETEDFDESTQISDDYADTFGVDNQQLTQFLVDYTINGSIMRVCAGKTAAEQAAVDLLRAIAPEDYESMAVVVLRAWKFGVVMGTEYARRAMAELNDNVHGDS